MLRMLEIVQIRPSNNRFDGEAVDTAYLKLGLVRLNVWVMTSSSRMYLSF